MKRFFIPSLIFLFISLSGCEPQQMQEMKANFDWQGHRGCRGILPENTIPAFLEALKYPVRTLELDVAISADTQVIVSHEPWMSAAICSFPDEGPVEETMEDSLLLYNLTYEEIKSFDCGRRGNARFPEQQPMPAYKPSLADVVQAVEAYCRDEGRTLPWYNIEIKSDPEWDGVRTPAPDVFARLVVEQIAALGIKDRAYIQSFDLRPLRAVRQIDSTLITALLVANAKGVDGNIEELGYTPEIYSPNYSLVTKGVVDRVHELGMTIVPWTVNDTLVMQEMIGLGVDGIITDYPNYIERVEGAMGKGL